VDSFETMGLCEPLLRGLTDAQHTTPTEIQRAALPLALAGRDLIGCAQTGSGKTAAFLLPALQLWTQDPKARAQTLILAPTRELAAQIEQSLKLYAKYLPVKSVAVYGGASMERQIAALRRGVDILIATPGRLEDLWKRGHISLPRLKVVVLDEADRMLDMGFEPQVRAILDRVPRERQTLLFSATMPPAMERMASRYLRQPERVEAQAPSSTVPTVDQVVHPVAPEQKQALLIELLQTLDADSILVFTRTKRGADRLHRALTRSGHAAERIHGDLTQGQRERALLQFRTGATRVLVATDLAARGLDIPSISHVINYDVPVWAEDYVHRIGRTGRAGRTGTAVTLASHAESKFLRSIETLIGHRLRTRLVDDFTYTPDLSQPETSTGPAARKSDQALSFLEWRYGKRTPAAAAVSAGGRGRGRR
jgi:ATP-dependent RNA helicase RhlE